jgi:hypothetical protein
MSEEQKSEDNSPEIERGLKIIANSIVPCKGYIKQYFFITILTDPKQQENLKTLN